MNFRMKQMVENGEAIDLSETPMMKDVYVLDNEFVVGADYCDLSEEVWIWSIGRHQKNGHIYAATDTRFYGDPDFECLWLR